MSNRRQISSNQELTIIRRDGIVAALIHGWSAIASIFRKHFFNTPRLPTTSEHEILLVASAWYAAAYRTNDRPRKYLGFPWIVGDYVAKIIPFRKEKV